MSLDITGKYRYPTPKPEWLEQHQEEILEPNLPIVDSHHHLWEQEGHPYLLEELSKDLKSGHNIIATMCVEAKYHYKVDGPEHLRCTGETEAFSLIRQASLQTGIATEVCQGVIGFCDLRLGQQRVREVIAKHRDSLGHRLKGIRHSVARDENFPEGVVIRPAPGHLLSDDEYQTGLKELENHGLVYEAMLYHQQIPELTSMARRNSDLQIVLNHYGCILGVGMYRGKEKENFTQWQRDIRELSKNINVKIKLGGLGMIVCGPTWHERELPPSSEELSEAWRPYYQTCIEAFGPDRCMFESNFPVDKAMYSYPVFWNACKRLSVNLSASEKTALFSGTAQTVYTLGK